MTNDSKTATSAASAPPAPPARQEENARERILGAAIGLFCEKGYETASVREIVEAAGVTKPVLYYYFNNKEDLFRQLIESSLIAFRKKIEEACHPADPEDFCACLAAISNVYIDSAEATPDLLRFFHSIAFSDLYNDVYDFVEFWLANLQNVIGLFERAQGRNEIRDDFSAELMARNFIGMAEAAMRERVYRPAPDIEPTNTAETIVDILMRGVAK